MTLTMMLTVMMMVVLFCQAAGVWWQSVCCQVVTGRTRRFLQTNFHSALSHQRTDNCCCKLLMTCFIQIIHLH